jgi:hypothetical protein
MLHPSSQEISSNSGKSVKQSSVIVAILEADYQHLVQSIFFSTELFATLAQGILRKTQSCGFE